MIEEVDVETMRQEGLAEFRSALVERVKAGIRPDTAFVQGALLKAMGPILRAIAGNDAKPEDHIRVHVVSGKDPDGQLSSYTQAEGLTQMGNVVIEAFMDLGHHAEA